MYYLYKTITFIKYVELSGGDYMKKRIFVILIIIAVIIFVFLFSAILKLKIEDEIFKNEVKKVSIEYVSITNEISNEFSLNYDYYTSNPEVCLELYKREGFSREVDSLVEDVENIMEGLSDVDRITMTNPVHVGSTLLEEIINYTEKTEPLTEEEYARVVELSIIMSENTKFIKEDLKQEWGMDASEVENLGISE